MIETAADKINYILKIRYWTQEHLADKLGVKQTTISAWRRGRMARDKYTDKIEQEYLVARELELVRLRKKVRSKLKPIQNSPKNGKVLSKGGKIRFYFPWYSH